METVHICAACLKKYKINHDPRSVDIIHECDACRVPDKCLTIDRSVFNILKRDLRSE